MKLFIIFILITYTSFSQLLPGGKSERYEGNQKSSSNDNGAFISFGLNLFEIDDNFGLEGNLAFANISKSSLIIGGGLNSVLFDTYKVENTSSFLRYTNGFGTIGYLFDFSKHLKLSPLLNIGVGRVNTSGSNLGINSDPNGDWYFFIEPKLDFDLKLYKSSFLTLSISNRFYNGIENYNLENNDFNGLVFGLSYKLLIL